MDYTKESPVILSLCTGIRGLERGIERVVGNITVAAYVEIEAFAAWNLVAAMESGFLDPAPVWTDVKTFPAREFHGRIHGIIGGYPCQPFSNAGKRKGEEDPRHLWPFVEQQISTIKPLWCFFENVSGHFTLGFESVKKSLEKMGYRVEAGIYSAEEVGAPHRRERLFVLAVDDTNFNGTRRRFPNSQTWEKSSDKTTSPSGELADANRKDAGRREREIPDQAATAEGKAQGENGQWLRRVLTSGNMVIPDTSSQGLEGQWLRRRSTEKELPLSSGSRSDRFPSGRGEHQYAWEAPRTTQSGLGSTAHGYNFREDLLRALGNGVVEQTAELAFRDLLIKHHGWN